MVETVAHNRLIAAPSARSRLIADPWMAETVDHIQMIAATVDRSHQTSVGHNLTFVAAVVVRIRMTAAAVVVRIHLTSHDRCSETSRNLLNSDRSRRCSLAAAAAVRSPASTASWHRSRSVASSAAGRS